MASRSAVADPSRFAIDLGVGCAHVLVLVLGFLARVITSTHERDPVLVLVVLLALLLPFAYLRLAADGYRRSVERSNNVTPEQAAVADALSPAAVPVRGSGWLRNLVSIKLAVAVAVAVAFLVFGFVLAAARN